MIETKRSTAQIRRLQAEDAALYRELRLEALLRNPEAFSSTFECEAAQTPAWFADRLAGSSATFGAFARGDLLGIASFHIPPRVKEAHKGMLAGMYVRPAARRAGVARRLVDAVLDYARQRVELIELAVVSDNLAALHLYAGLGFVKYGREQNALKDDGRYYDLVLMAKPLITHISRQRFAQPS